MKPKKNFVPPNENGDETIIIGTTTNVSERECEDISNWKNPEFIRQYQMEYRKKHRRKAKKYYREYRKLHGDDLNSYHRKYHAKNKLRIHKQKREYYQEHKVRIHRKNRKNRKRLGEYNKIYYQNNKPRLMAEACRRIKLRYKTDLLFKVKMRLRGRLYDVCKCKKFIKPKTMELLGCDLKFFKAYMESLFAPGMTWGNHGKWGWHIDHIMPLDMAKTPEDMKLLCNYKNLQPLWWYDNLSKSGTVPQTKKHNLNKESI